LKYLDRESFPQAVSAFWAENTSAAREQEDAALFTRLVEPVIGANGVLQRAIFEMTAEQLADERAVQACIDGLREGPGRGKNNPSPLLGLLEEVTAEWMRITRHKISQAMPPRNCQVRAFPVVMPCFSDTLCR
jgi:hypothetical protein